MERIEYQQIGDVLRLAFQDNCMQDRLDEVKAASLWQNAVGCAIASQCGRPTVKGGVMTVAIANASLRHELNMNRSLLAKEINRLVGKNVITNIRLIAAASTAWR